MIANVLPISTKPRFRFLNFSIAASQVLIYKLYNKWKLTYRAFCAGSIITLERVLTSANCLLTNRKRHRTNFRQVKVAGGVLHTYTQQPINDDVQQWRSIAHVYSQKFYRYPAYDLAILKIDKPWIFGQFVNKIPYASVDQDFDGVCTATAVKATKSWSASKYVFTERKHLLNRRSCEHTLLRSCRLYICTRYNKHEIYAYSETEGGGVICHGTDDPNEVDEMEGILVGVTTLINIGLPSLHTRVGLFHKWVTDGSCKFTSSVFLLCIICLFNKLF